MAEWKFEAIGTVWIVSTAKKLSNKITQQITNRIDTFDQTYSRFKVDSLVTRMSHSTGEYTLPEDAEVLLDFYLQLYKLTEGQVTPLIGKTMEQAGYDAEYSFKPKKLKIGRAHV